MQNGPIHSWIVGGIHGVRPLCFQGACFERIANHTGSSRATNICRSSVGMQGYRCFMGTEFPSVSRTRIFRPMAGILLLLSLRASPLFEESFSWIS